MNSPCQETGRADCGATVVRYLQSCGRIFNLSNCLKGLPQLCAKKSYTLLCPHLLGISVWKMSKNYLADVWTPRAHHVLCSWNLQQNTSISHSYCTCRASWIDARWWIVVYPNQAYNVNLAFFDKTFSRQEKVRIHTHYCSDRSRCLRAVVGRQYRRIRRVFFIEQLEYFFLRQGQTGCWIFG